MTPPGRARGIHAGSTPCPALSGRFFGLVLCEPKGFAVRCPECKHEHPVACPSCRVEIQDEEVAVMPDAPPDEPPADDAPADEITPDERPAPIEETPAETPRTRKTLFEHLFGE